MTTMNDYIKAEANVCAQNYAPLPVVLKKGEGVWLWDTEGNKYLDMMSAYSAVSHGHCNPRLVQSLVSQASALCVTSRAFHHDQLMPFLNTLCDMTGMERAIPANTGVEAVEAAIKAARRWGYERKGIEKDCAEIIVASDNFHGRTTTVVSFSSDPVAKENFGPFTPGFVPVPFGDLSALEAAINKNTCAFLVEPIQGEAGINVPPAGWLKAAHELCKQHNVLLICDEIQTGLARTGKLLACQHEDVMPDGLILGKALGGGILPVSAFLTREDVMSVFTPGSHGSTFGGNPLACAVAHEALRIIQDEDFVARSASLGAYLMEGLRELKSDLISNVRGRGLLIGVEINTQKIKAKDMCLALMRQGILSKEAHEKVIRFAPPLIITEEELDWALLQFKKAIDSITS